MPYQHKIPVLATVQLLLTTALPRRQHLFQQLLSLFPRFAFSFMLHLLHGLKLGEQANPPELVELPLELVNLIDELPAGHLVAGG
jgi:hypothetical protein